MSDTYIDRLQEAWDNWDEEEKYSEVNKMYGIYNTIKKEFQFGIKEPSKSKAQKKLFEKIGKDAYKWRFEVREIKLSEVLERASEYADKINF